MSADTSITANVSGGEVGIVAQQVHIEHQYLGVPALSARGPADLGIARIFQTRTRAFTDEYLVSETGPVPFGGRDEELRRLDEWLLNPQSPPRMLVTAPAGRGKSALLVRWMKNLQEGGGCGADGWQLAFMPISIRTGTNRPEVFYEGLARRLSEITNEPLPTEAFRDGEGFRYAVREQLDWVVSRGKPRTLVVIDGIDEAPEGSFEAGVLPTRMPKNVRILLSARWQLGDHNSDGWLERLGWDRGSKVEAFELNRLDAARIADVLIKLSAPVDVLTQEPALVERLALLTEGEPLLVRYFAEDLWGASSKGSRITGADLDQLRPGFDSYFKRWFGLQERLWKEEGAQVDPNQIDAILSVLAFALGPLSEQDMRALLKRIHGLTRVIALDRLLNPLRRWVFGGSQGDYGYVLSHPRVGEFLQRNRFAGDADEIRKGFSDWGKAHAADLNQGRLQPEQASSCCLQFLPAYMKQAKDPPEDFMVMVENGWRLAWEAFEGGQQGFASAVRAAFEALRQDKTDLRVGSRWRCALTLSSIKSLGVNLPEELALAAVDKGVLTIRQAAYFADLKGPSVESVKLLLGLVLASSENPVFQSELLVSALIAARAIHFDFERSMALTALVPHLAPEQRDQVLREALTTAQEIRHDILRATALAALVPHLAAEQHDQVVREALTAAKAIRHDHFRAQALATVARHLSAERQDEVVSEALAAAKTIGLEGDRDLFRSQALAELAPQLAPSQVSEALTTARAIDKESSRASALVALAPHLAPPQVSEALAAAKAIGDDSDRARVLTALVPRLAPEQRDEVLQEVLAAAKATGSHGYGRARALAAVAPYIAPEQHGKVVREALAAAKAIGDNSDRAGVLVALVPYLAPPQVSEALAAAKAIGDCDTRAHALIALVPHLAPRRRYKVLQEALAAARTTGSNDYRRATALAALVPHLAPEQHDEVVREAFAAAKAIGPEDLRVEALAAVADHLAPEQRDEVVRQMLAAGSHDALTALVSHLARAQRDEILQKALAAAKATGYDVYRRAQALAAVVPHLAPEQRDEVVREALAAAKACRDFRGSWALVGLAPHLTPEQTSEALAAAKTFGDDSDRARVLTALAPHLTPEQTSEALAAAKSFGDESDRAWVLTALVPRLAPEQMSEALAAAKTFGDDSHRAEVLTALVPRLVPGQRDEVLQEALAAAKATVDDEIRAHALVALIPSSPRRKLINQSGKLLMPSVLLQGDQR